MSLSSLDLVTHADEISKSLTWKVMDQSSVLRMLSETRADVEKGKKGVMGRLRTQIHMEKQE